MSSAFDAIGDVISGSLLGRTVEPSAGEGGAHGDVCLNCQTALIGKHCHSCGQAGHVHRTLAAFGHDFLHGVLHFEGKIWRTLPLLIWQPGQLTRRYIDGERARFVSPLALFLFMMFAMFAVFSLTAGHLDELADSKPKYVKEARIELIKKLTIAQAEVISLRAKAAALPANSEDKADAAKDVKEANGDVAEITKSLQVLAKLPDDQLQNKDNDFNVTNIKWKIPAIDESIAKAQKNPALFLYKIQNAAYKYSWALIPISIPFVWLMFAWRRNFKLYDHAVFTTYSLCFMAMLTMLASIIGKYLLAGDGWIAAFVLTLLFVPLLHMHRQLRGTYELGRINALVRTFYLANVALLVMSLFLALLIVLGALG